MTSIFIFIENFFPAYKAGGPIQSITNLILALEERYKIYVITSAHDLQEKSVLDGIEPNCWQNILLPQGKKEIKVWYAENDVLSYKLINKLLRKFNPDFIYLNGIFSFRFFLLPLLVNHQLKSKIIICPRGMLQMGALKNKFFKKKIYLKILKKSGLLNKLSWHATNDEEKSDILKEISFKAAVTIALNIPKRPLEKINIINKPSGECRLVYLSLITEKKNLLFLLKVMMLTQNISLDIYGPIKDLNYWRECEKLINGMTQKVKYNGDILPEQVQEKFSQYHTSVLLTKGENFGHALYESMSVGRPVLTSDFTPWKNLNERKAGWNADISNIKECVNLLNKIKTLTQNEYADYCDGSYKLAKDYFEKSADLNAYKQLFSGRE